MNNGAGPFKASKALVQMMFKNNNSPQDIVNAIVLAMLSKKKSWKPFLRCQSGQ
jgi:hypothetical protein